MCADTTTTTYSLTKPEVGASEDTWGTKTNTNWDSVDALLDGTTVLQGPALDSDTTIQDTGDATKKAQFSVSNIATATTRTFAFPNNSGTLLTNSLDATISGDWNFTQNLGIGSASPSAPLGFGKAVYGDPSSEDFYRVKIQEQGGTQNDVGIGQPNSGSLAFNFTPNVGSYMAFYGGTNGEFMRLDADGNLGIGTTSPRESIDAIGAIVTDRGAIGANPVVYFSHDNFGAYTDNSIQVNRTTERFEFRTDTTVRATLGANGLALENGPAVDGFIDEDDMASDSATRVPTQQSTKAYVDGRVGEQYTSSEVSFPSSAGATAFTHGLGSAPKEVNAWMVCTSAELGYSVGDIVPLAGSSDGDGSRNYGMRVTSTQIIFLRDGSSLSITQNGGSYSMVAFTPGSWNLQVRGRL